MPSAPDAPRRRSRQAALQVLYAADLAPTGARSQALELVFESVAENFELPEGARAFSKELALGVAAARSELDDLVARHARNWKLSRMAAVDRNILRLAAYELARSDTPTSIVIDEAIELARRFGGESSPGFVNGVLDALARELRGGAPPEEEP